MEIPDGTTKWRISRKSFSSYDLAPRGRGKLTQTRLSNYFKTTSEDNEQRARINSDINGSVGLWWNMTELF